MCLLAEPSTNLAGPAAKAGRPVALEAELPTSAPRARSLFLSGGRGVSILFAPRYLCDSCWCRYCFFFLISSSLRDTLVYTFSSDVSRSMLVVLCVCEVGYIL